MKKVILHQPLPKEENKQTKSYCFICSSEHLLLEQHTQEPWWRRITHEKMMEDGEQVIKQEYKTFRKVIRRRDIEPEARKIADGYDEKGEYGMYDGDEIHALKARFISRFLTCVAQGRYKHMDEVMLIARDLTSFSFIKDSHYYKDHLF